MNRVTAVREFRVFHTALHSVNSAYRDSVSTNTYRSCCGSFSEPQNLVLPPKAHVIMWGFSIVPPQVKIILQLFPIFFDSISYDPPSKLFIRQCRMSLDVTNWTLSFRLIQIHKMLTNKESLDQIIVATPGLRSDPVALGKTC